MGQTLLSSCAYCYWKHLSLADVNRSTEWTIELCALCWGSLCFLGSVAARYSGCKLNGLLIIGRGRSSSSPKHWDNAVGPTQDLVQGVQGVISYGRSGGGCAA